MIYIQNNYINHKCPTSKVGQSRLGWILNTMRKFPLINDQYYHIFSRSIAKYVVFNTEKDYFRMIEYLNLYRFNEFKYKYSKFKRLSIKNQTDIINELQDTNKLVEIVAYCIMPTHFHLILKQISTNGISIFMARVLDGYSRYFNVLHERKGPLWDGHFTNVLIESDKQILHLTRYIHLNPVTAKIINKPKDWPYSSYMEYIDPRLNTLCEFSNLFDLSPKEYKVFVNDRIAYQRELSMIKHLILNDYSD